MKKLLDQNEFLKPPRIGDIIKGRVIGSGRSSLFVDLGIQGTGIVYGKEFYETKEKIKNLKVGDEVFSKILDLENEEGYIELSVREADKELSLEQLKTQKEKGETITVKILGANKGGLLAKVSGLPAFLPVSQLTIEHYPRVEKADKNKILKELQKFVGQELKVKIFDLDFKEKKLILSEKANDSARIKEILKKCKVGDVIDGEVTGIVDFGAFVKFTLPDENKETIEGLIHISELDWQIVDSPSKIVKLGQKVKAQIVEISESRVSLSLKALKKDPWQNIEENYKKGGVIKGRVTKFNPFGAFVSPGPDAAGTDESGIQGLVHISEFGSQKKMEELLKIGQEYNFEILQVEPEEHKLILKLR